MKTLPTLLLATTAALPIAANEPPVARPDLFGINSGETLTLDLLANDHDPDGDPLTIERLSVTSGSPEWLETRPDGSLAVTAPPDFDGLRVLYRISDGRGGTDRATAFILPPLSLAARRQEDAPPVARFGYACSFTAASPMRCTFDARASRDDVGVARYRWNFGDRAGSRTPRTHPTAEHLFIGDGPFEVTLTVWDTRGQPHTVTRHLAAEPAGNARLAGAATPPCRRAPTAKGGWSVTCPDDAQGL